MTLTLESKGLLFTLFLAGFVPAISVTPLILYKQNKTAIEKRSVIEIVGLSFGIAAAIGVIVMMLIMFFVFAVPSML
jgi:hypothetical protein